MKTGHDPVHAPRTIPLCVPAAPVPIVSGRARRGSHPASPRSPAARPPSFPLRRARAGTLLAAFVHLLAAALVVLLYLVVDVALADPAPSLVVTAAIGTWVVSLLSSTGGAR